jgi:hypothetical protein
MKALPIVYYIRRNKMTEDNRPMTPEEVLAYVNTVLGKQEEKPDFKKVRRFVERFGQVLNVPYEMLPCGCMYIVSENKDGYQTYTYFSMCPICKIKDEFKNHRNIYP